MQSSQKRIERSPKPGHSNGDRTTLDPKPAAVKNYATNNLKQRDLKKSPQRNNALNRSGPFSELSIDDKNRVSPPKNFSKAYAQLAMDLKS